MTYDANIHPACGRPSSYSANYSYELNTTAGEAVYSTRIVSIWTFLTGVVPLYAACIFEISDLYLLAICVCSVAAAYFAVKLKALGVHDVRKNPGSNCHCRNFGLGDKKIKILGRYAFRNGAVPKIYAFMMSNPVPRIPIES